MVLVHLFGLFGVPVETGLVVEAGDHVGYGTVEQMDIAIGRGWWCCAHVFVLLCFGIFGFCSFDRNYSGTKGKLVRLCMTTTMEFGRNVYVTVLFYLHNLQ